MACCLIPLQFLPEPDSPILPVANVSTDNSVPQRTVLQRVLFDLEDYPFAVCNDGTPAGYYWRNSSREEGRNLWIIYLQGGNWCYDEESCKKRSKTRKQAFQGRSDETSVFMSSHDWPDTVTYLGGIFDPPLGSPLAGANVAFVKYCTSDAHMGDRGASEATYGWHFRGHRVVEATIAELVRTHGLGKSHQEATPTLILGGGSAGARGAMIHLDYVKSFLHTHTDTHINVYGFLDSSLWLDIPIPTLLQLPESVSLINQTRAVKEIAQPSHLDPACASAHPDSSSWRCLFGEYRMPFVKTPYLLIASQNDAFQLFSNVHIWKDFFSENENIKRLQKEYVETFANRTVSFIKSLGGRPGFAMFSQKCWDHSVSLTSDFNQIVTESDETTTMLNALEAGLASLGWLPGVPKASDAQLLWYDTCTSSPDCGPCNRENSD